MIGTEKRSPEAELQALQELVTCDGWDVLQAHLDAAWGAEACLAAIDAALTKHVRPEDELAVTKRIRDTFKGVRAEAGWVKQRIAELETAVKAKAATPTEDRFAHLRRAR